MKRRLIALASFFAALVAFAGIDPARIDAIAAHLDAPRADGRLGQFRREWGARLTVFLEESGR